MKYILTTLGLSCLTNGLREIFDVRYIYKYSNLQQIDDDNFLKLFESNYQKLLNDIQNFDEIKLKKLSAEINALLRFNLNKNDINVLLYTDTFLGEKAANLVKEVLESKGFSAEIRKANDLKTDDIESFHIALADLARDLSIELQGYKDSGYEIIFNLTGGFKSVNSFLQSMATIYADKSIYIFESSNELLTIPRLPLKIDEEVIIKNIDLFRKLEIGFRVKESELKNIPRTLIMKIGDEYTLSAFGEMIWQKVKNDYYSRILLKPIGNIEYSNEFLKDFEKLSPNEKRALNKQIDNLEKFKLTGINLKSLNYHALNGEVSQKYSHEFYPFDGNDSRRAYCNEKDGKVIIEKIDAHLK